MNGLRKTARDQIDSPFVNSISIFGRSDLRSSESSSSVRVI
jgi:hypothetical protein